MESEKRQIISGLIIINFICLAVILKFISLNNKKNKLNSILKTNLDILSKQINYQRKYWSEDLRNHEEIKRLWHDMKNHLNIITALYENGDYYEFKNYLNSLNNEILRVQRKSITNNKILDALLRGKVELCKENDIDINLNIYIKENLPIENIDVCVIYSNLIDNAIEACNRIDDGSEKYIIVSSKSNKYYLYIEVENSISFYEEFDKKNNGFRTKKKDKKNHGIGLESIKKSIEKYDGQIKFYYDDKRFNVAILIKMR